MFIDAKRKFSTRHLLAFKTNHKDDEIVDCMLTNAGCVISYKLSELRSFFTDNSVIDIMKDDEIVDLNIDSDILEFTGYDYLWWIASVRNVPFKRLNKLFNENVDNNVVAVKTKRGAMYNVACGIKSDNIENIEKFNGLKNDVIEFMNKYYAKQLLKSYFKAKIVFCFNYQNEDELNDLSNWKSLDELASEGKVTLI